MSKKKKRIFGLFMLTFICEIFFIQIYSDFYSYKSLNLDEKYTFQGFSSSLISWDGDKRHFKLSYNA